MLFQRINRSNPEKVFMTVYNDYSTAAITVGQPVIWDYASSANGVGVTKPTATHGGAFAGIVADTSIAAGAYGLIQVWGYNADAIVDGATDVAAGDMLVANAATFELYKMATGSAVVLTVPCALALAAITATTAAATAVFIKGL